MSGQSEVGYLKDPVLADKQVRTLDVAVKDTLVVAVLDSRQ